jgi:hypothetical protein
MGMFDHVNFKTKCPNCSADVSGFQTKDSKCLMQEVEPWTVRNFYTSCSECNTWIEYTNKNGSPSNNLLLEEALGLLHQLKDVIYEVDYENVQEFLSRAEPKNWLDNYEVTTHPIKSITLTDEEE